MKIESVLEMNLNTQCASGALLPPSQLLCHSRTAAVVFPQPEKKKAAPLHRASSLNSLVRAELAGGKSGFDLAENISFAVILAVTAAAFVYLLATVDQFVTALPHFSQFVQGCL